MTKEQLLAEMAYHASLQPFTCLLNDGAITAEDYEKIKTILTNKYRPIFVGYIPPEQLDNVTIQR